MRLLPILAVLLLGSMPALAAPQLRTQVSVDRETVQLGDLFTGLPAGVRGDIDVGRAPAPGKTAHFDAAFLAALSATNGLGWQPATRFDRVTVERAAQVIGYEVVRSALGDALRAQGLPVGAEVVLDNEQLKILLPSGRPGTLSIEQLSYAPNRDRFSAMIVAPANDPAAERVKIQGRVIHMTEVAVPARAIQTGEIIRARDLQIVRLRTDQVGKANLAEAGQLVGRSARRPLAANQPVRASDLVMPTVITRNAMITVKVASDRMSLSMQAKALDDGAIGDTVRVQNTRSNRIIQGVVTAAGEVTVNTAYSVAAN
jgi:flagella basal body P-ring formation protein FlgA